MLTSLRTRKHQYAHSIGTLPSVAKSHRYEMHGPTIHVLSRQQRRKLPRRQVYVSSMDEEALQYLRQRRYPNRYPNRPRPLNGPIDARRRPPPRRPKVVRLRKVAPEPMFQPQFVPGFLEHQLEELVQVCHVSKQRHRMRKISRIIKTTVAWALSLRHKLPPRKAYKSLRAKISSFVWFLSYWIVKRSVTCRKIVSDAAANFIEQTFYCM